MQQVPDPLAQGDEQLKLYAQPWWLWWQNVHLQFVFASHAPGNFALKDCTGYCTPSDCPQSAGTHKCLAASRKGLIHIFCELCCSCTDLMSIGKVHFTLNLNRYHVIWTAVHQYFLPDVLGDAGGCTKPICLKLSECCCGVELYLCWALHGSSMPVWRDGLMALCLNELAPEPCISQFLSLLGVRFDTCSPHPPIGPSFHSSRMVPAPARRCGSDATGHLGAVGLWQRVRQVESWDMQQFFS